MKCGFKKFNRFDDNQLIKLANLVQFKRVLMSCVKDYGPGPLRSSLFTLLVLVES